MKLSVMCISATEVKPKEFQAIQVQEFEHESLPAYSKKIKI